MKRLKVAVILAVLCGALVMPQMQAKAVSDNDGNVSTKREEVSSEDRADAKNQLYRYYDNLMILNDDLKKEHKDKLTEIINSAKKDIGNAETLADLSAAVSDTKSLMSAYIDKVIADIPTSTSEFLVIGDNAPVAKAVHGQPVTVVLPIYNMGAEWIDDVTVTPTVSNSVKEWPFEIAKTGYSERITEIPGSTNKDEAWLNHREIHYSFVTREDVLDGYYKLEFNVVYRRNNKSETAKLYTFVQAEGAPGSGSIDGTGEDGSKSSKPRIVVTGFSTSPEEIYAGDTFDLTIHFKNTSQRTAVSNIEVNLEAATEGKDENTLYASFLPTSGSNTIYIDGIPSGGTADMTIEMTAKADLVQKPYALNVKMDYEDDKYNPYTASSSVSIPVRQEAKFDTSTPEVMPTDITVGTQSNIMFSIYNTGKTTLYNVQVKFESPSIVGGETFVGKLEAGATGNVDAMVTGQAPTMDEGTVKIVITYEDDAGNVSTAEKEVTLLVTEEMMDPSGGGMMEDPEMMEEPKSKTPIIVGSIVAGIVIILVAVGVVLKRRKKKKEAKELAEDLMDLDLEDEADKK